MASRATQPIAKVQFEPYAGVFLPGGHGTMWDFPDNSALAKLVGEAVEAGVPVGSVCHGPAGLISARRKDGQSIVAGRRINGFTNAEESAAGMTKVVPFLLETRLRELGGRFENAEVFAAFAVRDGALITGQNPASSERAAQLVLEAIAERKSETAGAG
jgi:putative intracellular protease/amidase